MSSIRKFIRPNRDDVIKWYIQLAMVVVWLFSRDITAFIVDAASIENGMIKWLIRIVAVGIPFLVFIRVTDVAPSTSVNIDHES